MRLVQIWRECAVLITTKNKLLTTKFLVVFLFRKNRSKTMKSKILITSAILCAISAAPAHAVTKCVALNSSTTCTSNYSAYQYHTDWAATCTTNGVRTPISGIGICSSTEASKYQTATELDTSSTSANNKYCWCKMTSPAVSRWVFVSRPLASAGSCAMNCAYFCADYVRSIAVFRSALFGSLSD